MECSPQVGTLVSALAKAQGEFKPAVKDSNNPYYNSKYADLATIIEATRPALTKHGIAVTHSCTSDLERQAASVTTTLRCGEEWIAATAEAPAVGKAKDGGIRFDAQTIGAAWTYLRRYTLQGLLGIASEDDDGNALVTEQAPPPAARREPPHVVKGDQFAGAQDKWRKVLIECESPEEYEANVLPLLKERTLEFVSVADMAMIGRWFDLLPTVDAFNRSTLDVSRAAFDTRKSLVNTIATEAKRRGYRVNRASGSYEQGAAA